MDWHINIIWRFMGLLSTATLPDTVCGWEEPLGSDIHTLLEIKMITQAFCYPEQQRLKVSKNYPWGIEKLHLCLGIYFSCWIWIIVWWVLQKFRERQTQIRRQGAVSRTWKHRCHHVVFIYNMTLYNVALLTWGVIKNKIIKLIRFPFTISRKFVNSAKTFSSSRLCNAQ